MSRKRSSISTSVNRSASVLSSCVAAVGLESGELQLRLGARGEDEAAARRRVPQDLVPEAADLRDAGDVLPVVDDEGAWLGQGVVHLRQQVGSDAGARWIRGLPAAEACVRPMSETRMALADRLDQVADVERPVAIVAVELVPVARESDFALPLPEEGRLSITGVRRNDHGAAGGSGIEPIEEPRTPQQGRHVVRRLDLVLDERVGVLDVRQRRTLPPRAKSIRSAAYRRITHALVRCG